MSARPRERWNTTFEIVMFLNPPFDSVPNLIRPVGPSRSGAAVVVRPYVPSSTVPTSPRKSAPSSPPRGRRTRRPARFKGYRANRYGLRAPHAVKHQRRKRDWAPAHTAPARVRKG